jgi:predicted dehydrogenase
VAETIRVGIIGVGQIGKTHVESYSKMPDVEIVAVADVNEAEARRVADKYGVKHAFANFRDLLKLDEIQSVDVCLHNNFHAPITIAALEAGKHVMSEKPMAGSYTDALAMKQASERTGQRLGVMLRYITSKESKAARRLIDAGALGEIYYGRAVGFRRRGRPFVDGYGTSSFVQKATAAGGALYDMGVYHISNMLYLLGSSDVLTISGATHQAIPMDEARRASSGYDVEELGIGLVRLAGGITMQLEESWAMHYDSSESNKILGSKGGIKLDPFTFFSSQADLELNSTAELGLAEFRLHSLNPDYEAYDSIERQWIATLQGRVPPIDTAAIGLATMLISEGIYLSQQLGREVTADEVREHSVSSAIKGL